MKRAPFIGTAAAVLLSGCGGRHISNALPGVATSNGNSKNTNSSLQLVPAVADAIPANVLAQPFLGEARRFDGTAAPTNWMFAQGQTLTIAENRALFGVLGNSVGGDGKTTFKLPNVKFGLIVAVAGQLVTSPSALARSGRRLTARDSLGEGARPRLPHMLPQPSAQTNAERRLISSALRVGPPNPVPVPAELNNRIARAEQEARSAAIESLSGDNRARLDASISAVVDGRTNLYDAIVEMASSLTGAEADALVRINDALIRQFNDRWAGNQRQQLQYDAAQFLYAETITREQAHAMYLRTRRRNR